MLLMSIASFVAGVLTGIAVCKRHIRKRAANYPWMPVPAPQIERGDAITVVGEVGNPSVRSARIRTVRIRRSN